MHISPGIFEIVCLHESAMLYIPNVILLRIATTHGMIHYHIYYAHNLWR